jgi:hypothetical protein
MPAAVGFLDRSAASSEFGPASTFFIDPGGKRSERTSPVASILALQAAAGSARLRMATGTISDHAANAEKNSGLLSERRPALEDIETL